MDKRIIEYCWHPKSLYLRKFELEKIKNSTQNKKCSKYLGSSINFQYWGFSECSISKSPALMIRPPFIGSPGGRPPFMLSAGGGPLFVLSPGGRLSLVLFSGAWPAPGTAGVPDSGVAGVLDSGNTGGGFPLLLKSLYVPQTNKNSKIKYKNRIIELVVIEKRLVIVPSIYQLK